MQPAAAPTLCDPVPLPPPYPMCQEREGLGIGHRTLQTLQMNKQKDTAVGAQTAQKSRLTSLSCAAQTKKQPVTSVPPRGGLVSMGTPSAAETTERREHQLIVHRWANCQTKEEVLFFSQCNSRMRKTSISESGLAWPESAAPGP